MHISIRLAVAFPTIAAIIAWRTTCASAAPGGCQGEGCGTNTPELYGTPVLGLSTKGATNAEGVTIVPGSLQPARSGRCGAERNLDLGVKDGKFEGWRAKAVVCKSDDLVGATFTISVPRTPLCGPAPRHAAPPRGAVRVTIGIADGPIEIKTWHRLPAQQETLYAYKLVWGRGAPRGKKQGTSICPKMLAPMSDGQYQRVNAWIKGMESKTSADFTRADYAKSLGITDADERWVKDSDYLIISQGEVYGIESHTLDVTREGPDWFAFGCYRSATAKMRFLGFNALTDPPGTRSHRIATLAMLGGWYHLSAPFYTLPGVDLYWRWLGAPRPYHGDADPTVTGGDGKVHPIEAFWNEDGAMCVSHRRTWLDSHGGWLDSAFKRDAIRAAEYDLPTEIEKIMLTGGFIRLHDELKQGTVRTSAQSASDQAHARQTESQSLDEIAKGACFDGGPNGTAPAGALWETRTVDHIPD